MKTFITTLILAFTCQLLFAQNTGIGTTTPEAKLHINGDLKLQNGFAVNKFSRDSLFAENSHNNVPTEKAIKEYIQKGMWGTATDTSGAGSQAPVPRGFTDRFLNGPVSVAKQGNYAFVASYNSDQLMSFNITNPDSIYHRSDISTNLDGPVDVFVQGNYAYVVSELNDRLCIYDISNPPVITAKGFTSTNIRKPTSVFVQGNYAYVTSDLLNRMSIFDISNPDAIVAKGSTGTNMSLPAEVYVQGNFAYVACRANNRMCIYDISNPDLIVARGFTSTGLTDPVSVHIKGDYAYVTSRNNITGSRIRIFNISNPDLISPASSITDGVYGPLKLHVTGNVLVVADGYNTIRLYNISNPLLPIPVGISAANLNGLNYVFATGDYIYATSYSNNRLCVFDLNRISNIQVTPSGIQTAPVLWQPVQNNIYRGNGNVGIGTSNPLAKLNVAGQIFIEQDQVGGYGGLLIRGNAPGSNYPNIGFAVNNGVNYAGAGVAALIQGDIINNGNGTENMDITFHTSEAGQYSMSERMRIKGNGNIGIGTTAPTNKFSVTGNTDISGRLGIGTTTPVKQTEIIGAASATPVTLVIGNRGGFGPAAMEFVSDYGLASQWRPGYIRSNDTGGFTGTLEFCTNGTGSGNLYGTVKGLEVRNGQTLTATGAVGAYSDARLKENIQPFTDGLNVINKINPVQFTYNRQAPFASTQLQTGILAQELEKIAPYMVEQTTQNGFTDLRYVNNQAYTFLLINAVKEQQQQIEQQQRQLLQQQKEISAIKQLLQQLTQK